MSIKFPVTLTGIEPATFRLVAQCLKSMLSNYPFKVLQYTLFMEFYFCYIIYGNYVIVGLVQFT